ncbi:hypothetical protein KKF61_05005, partial [Patescibacteria group bacterium]|nr:hypothetical protein [Patescibacteria group bacterium]
MTGEQVKDGEQVIETDVPEEQLGQTIIQQKVPFWGPFIVEKISSKYFKEVIKAIVLVIAILYARQLFLGHHLFWAVIVLAPAILWSCYHKTPVAHRALMLFLGMRTRFAAPWEGFFPRIPLLTSYECVDVREYTKTLGYEDFVAGDGIPFSFELFLAFRVVNTEDEEELVEEFSFSHSGSLLRDYLSLGGGSAVSQIESIGQSILEVIFVRYTHSQLIGFSIAEFEDLLQKEIDKGSDEIPDIAGIAEKFIQGSDSEAM